MSAQVRPRCIRLVGVALVVVAGACRGSDSNPGGAASMQGIPGGSGAGDVWVTFRTDRESCDSGEDCARLAHFINLHRPEWSLGHIDLTMYGGESSAVLQAPDQAVILRGRRRGSSLVASQAFRGLPGHEAREADVFVQAAGEGSADRVGSSALVTVLNTGANASVPAFDFSMIETGSLDRAWIRRSVDERGAIVAGRFFGEADGRGIVRFEVRQVYVPIAAGEPPCPVDGLHRCPHGTVPTFARDADRCLVAISCRRLGTCLDERPECAPGYVLRSWRAEPRGCLAYACDPDFLAE